MKEFYSNGKLLLSGEYAVLDGAKAWAVPTKFGQYLKVSKNDSQKLTWKSLDEQGNSWFSGVYRIPDLTEITVSEKEISKILCKIILEAKKLNPSFLTDASGFEVETRLTFPRNWGLGSSSTLINNIAQWAQVDPYELLWNAFSGSGYDIACAQNNLAVIYQLEDGKPTVKTIETKPLFSNSLYFVYLNKKRNSRNAISAYRQRKINKRAFVEKISELTDRMIVCSELDTFEHLVTAHETMLSEALGIPTVKEELFSDYPKSMKSLGAWGGDFILAVGDDTTIDYFKGKGYLTVLSFQEMIK